MKFRTSLPVAGAFLVAFAGPGCGGEDAEPGVDLPPDMPRAPVAPVESPPEAPPPLAPIELTVVAGGGHTCVRLETGAVRCWGDNEYGQTGHPGHDWVGGERGASISSFPDVDVGGAVTQLSAGGSHTCALLSTGAVRCWGSGEHGELGYGYPDNVGDDELPSLAGDINVGGGMVRQIATGPANTCVLLESGSVRCWGVGEYGQLGFGHLEGMEADGAFWTPGDVDLGGSARQIAMGGAHSCALMDTGGVRCWGHGSEGELGYGNTEGIGDDEAPASAGDVEVGGTVTQIGLGLHHTCVLLDTGAVRCWGRGSDGALGHGNTESIGDDEAPASAGDVPLGGRATEIAVGSYHTCALLDSGRVRCWGDPTVTGSLGYGHIRTIGDDETPASEGDVDVGGPVDQLAAGEGHTCALLRSGRLRCWGAGGSLGYPSGEFIGNDETPASAGDVPFR